MRNLKRIYNCVDLKDPVAKGKAREGHGVKFLYVGRFVEDKGLESLIEGFEAVSAEYPDNRLQTVGPQSDSAGADSRFYERMRRRVESGQCATRIQFRDSVFDKIELNRIIEAADVVCVPSLSGETFSMAILEAMALAKAVLVSDFSPMPEAVDHEKTGYVARSGDSASIADGMRFFSQRTSEIERIGRRGWEKAKQLFAVERIAGEYLEDFEFLVGQRSRSRQNDVVFAR